MCTGKKFRCMFLGTLSQSRDKISSYASHGNSISPSLEQGAALKKARQGRSSAREQRCVTATQAIPQEIFDSTHERLDAKGHVSMRVIIVCARHHIIDLAVLRSHRRRVVMRLECRRSRTSPSKPSKLSRDCSTKVCTLAEKNSVQLYLGDRVNHFSKTVSWTGYRAAMRVTASITTHDVRTTDSCSLGGR
jgi:hypothetical protein